MTGKLTVEQLAQLRRFAAEQATRSAAGREWLARVRPVAAELERIYSGQPTVRDRIERALALAAPLVQSPETRITDDVLHATGEALTAIEKSASPELSLITNDARRELKQAGDKTLREVFGL